MFNIISVIKKLKFRIELRIMDQMWEDWFGYCFGMYPPSFYYLHTPEEQERIMKEDIEKLRRKIEKL